MLAQQEGLEPPTLGTQIRTRSTHFRPFRDDSFNNTQNFTELYISYLNDLYSERVIGQYHLKIGIEGDFHAASRAFIPTDKLCSSSPSLSQRMNTNSKKTIKAQFHLQRLLPAVLSLMLAGMADSALADTSGTQGGISVHYGVGKQYKRYTLNYEAASVWTTKFSGNWGRLDLTPEIGVSYWTADGSRSPSQAWQFSAIPMFRWWTTERFYIEAGIGVTALTRTRFADKNIGSAFQFGDHIGAGFLLTRHDRIGLRLSHFSNAGIKRPNPGLDTLQLTYTYQF